MMFPRMRRSGFCSRMHTGPGRARTVRHVQCRSGCLTDKRSLQLRHLAGTSFASDARCRDMNGLPEDVRAMKGLAIFSAKLRASQALGIRYRLAMHWRQAFS